MKPKDLKKEKKPFFTKLKPGSVQNLNIKALDSKRLQMFSGKRGK